MTDDEFDKFLGGAFKRYAETRQADETAVARVMTRLAAPLPPQKKPFWRLPAVLLDWEFDPAWPRMAALGACAALGFFVGIAGIDRSIDQLDGQPTVAGTGIGSIVFEPEPLTGARP